jgi:Lsr2
MAQSATANLIDDIDQSTASETVRFGVDGTAYEIDLSAKHASELRSVVGRYISVARKIRPASPRAPQQRQPRTRAKADTQDELAITESVASVKTEVRDDHGLSDGEKQELRNIADAAGPRRNIVAGRLRTKGLVDRDTVGNWWLTDSGRRELMPA